MENLDNLNINEFEHEDYVEVQPTGSYNRTVISKRTGEAKVYKSGAKKGQRITRKIEVNEVVFKTMRIRGDKHFVTHSEYLKKDSAVVLQQMSHKDKINIVNEARSRKKERMGQKGRPPRDYIALMFSTPEQIQVDVRNMNKKELKKLVDVFIYTLLKSIKTLHPKANTDWLKKNMDIVFHKDTNNGHWHILLPHFTVRRETKLGKNLGRKIYDQINWSNDFLSKNARRKMYSEFQKIQSKELNTMTMEEYTSMVKSKSSKQSNQSVKNIRKEAAEELDLAITIREEAEQERYQLDVKNKTLTQQAEQLTKILMEYERKLKLHMDKLTAEESKEELKRLEKLKKLQEHMKNNKDRSKRVNTTLKHSKVLNNELLQEQTPDKD